MLEIIEYIANSTTLTITALIFSAIILEKKEIKINKKKVIAIIIAIIIYSIGIKYLQGTVKTLSLCCIYAILFKYIFKISYYETILLTFMYSIIIMIPDILFLLILINILKIDPTICHTKLTGSIISNLSVNLLLIIIVFIFRKLLRKLIKIKPNQSIRIVIYTIITLGSILIVFYNAITNMEIISGDLIISVAIILAFITILYSLLKQKMENEKIEEKYDKLLEFIKKYEVIIEEQRELRHESKNQLITVKSKVLNKEEGKEIIKYVDSLLKDHKSYKEDKYGMFQYLPSNGIKGLFYYKSMEAEEKGINLSIRIAEKVEKSILSKLSTEDFKQLGRLVGVYLDNAIEASSNSEEKKLGIEIYKHNEDVIIIITNTYSGEIEKESIGKVRYSTKGKNRGYGLMLVNKILSKNKRFVSENTITDKLYFQKLVIKEN